MPVHKQLSSSIIFMICSLRLPQQAKSSASPPPWARYIDHSVNLRRLLSGTASTSNSPTRSATHLPRAQPNLNWVNSPSLPTTTRQQHQQQEQVLQSTYPPRVHSAWHSLHAGTGYSALHWQWKAVISPLPKA